MKNNKSNSNLTTIILLFVVLVMSSSCNKPETQIDSKTGKHQIELKYASSITKLNGIYKIDTNIILANRNKKELVAALVSENLADKNSVMEIPDFIKAFLINCSKEKKFAMANPGEKYQEGWFDLGKGVPTKQLIYFGCGKNIALFSYYSGGIRRYQNLVILKFEGNKILDFWFDNNDVGVKTKKEMLEYLQTNRSGNGNC